MNSNIQHTQQVFDIKCLVISWKFVPLFFALTTCLFPGHVVSEPFCGVYLHPGEFTDKTLTVEERAALIEEALDSIRDCGFTTVIPYANTTSGKAYWPGTNLTMATQDEWDVLGVVAQKARQRGLKVMPALCVLSAGHDEPAGILESHTDWALQDKNGNPLGWISPANEDAQAWVLHLMEQLMHHIEPDGIMLDYMRYPNERDVRLDPVSEERFMQEAPENEDEDSAAKRLQSFKETSLTHLMADIAVMVRKDFPEAKIGLYSWGPHVPFNHPVAQCWPDWVRDNYLDVLNVSGYCYPDNYGKLYLEVFEKRLLDSASLVKKVDGKAELTFALGVRTSHGALKNAAEIEDYLTVAQKAGFSGVAVFAWASMKNFATEAEAEGYFRLTSDDEN